MENDLISRKALLEWAREFYPYEKVFVSAVINAPAVKTTSLRPVGMTDQQVIEQLTIMQCQYAHIRQSNAEWEAIERAKEVLAERN